MFAPAQRFFSHSLKEEWAGVAGLKARAAAPAALQTTVLQNGITVASTDDLGPASSLCESRRCLGLGRDGCAGVTVGRGAGLAGCRLPWPCGSFFLGRLRAACLGAFPPAPSPTHSQDGLCQRRLAPRDGGDGRQRAAGGRSCLPGHGQPLGAAHQARDRVARHPHRVGVHARPRRVFGLRPPRVRAWRRWWRCWPCSLYCWCYAGAFAGATVAVAMVAIVSVGWPW